MHLERKREKLVIIHACVWFMQEYDDTMFSLKLSLYILCMRERVCILDHVERFHASLHLAIPDALQVLFGCNLHGHMEQAQLYHSRFKLQQRTKFKF